MIVERTYKLPLQTRVTFKWQADPPLVDIEWTQRMPSVRAPRARRRFRAAYNNCRRQFWQEVVHLTGGAIAIVDVDGEYKSIQPPTKPS